MTTSAVATKVTPTAVLITTLVEVPLFVAVFTLADATVVLPIIISEVVTNVVPNVIAKVIYGCIYRKMVRMLRTNTNTIGTIGRCTAVSKQCIDKLGFGCLVVMDGCGC